MKAYCPNCKCMREIIGLLLINLYKVCLLYTGACSVCNKKLYRRKNRMQLHRKEKGKPIQKLNDFINSRVMPYKIVSAKYLLDKNVIKKINIKDTNK